MNEGALMVNKFISHSSPISLLKTKTGRWMTHRTRKPIFCRTSKQLLTCNSRWLEKVQWKLHKREGCVPELCSAKCGCRTIRISKVILKSFKNNCAGTSLVVQWLRIRLPMQGTRVRALVREDPTCRGATKPVSHNYWACALEPASHNYWAREPQLLSLCSRALEPQLLKPARLEPVLHNKRGHCSEKPVHSNKE